MTGTLQRKVLSTATALAVAAGAVVLFRLGVQRLVLGSGDRTADFAVAPLTLVPAPREFDLGRLIPAALDFYVAGSSFSERGEELAMPAALAEEISRNEAEAAGWKPLALPSLRTLAVDALVGRLWRRPDGTFVLRRIRPVTAATSRRTDWVLPLGGLPPSGESMPAAERPAAAAPAVPAEPTGNPYALLAESLARGGGAWRSQLPGVLNDVLVGELFLSRCIRRGCGAAFYATTLVPGTPQAAQERFRAAAGRAGWSFDASGLRAERGNLSVATLFQPFGATATSCTYRFADDENLTKNELTRKEEDGNEE